MMTPPASMTEAAQALLAKAFTQYDFEDEHMRRTAERFASMLLEMGRREEFDFTTFKSNTDEMVILSPLPFYTMCAHHIVPFYGEAHIAYVPGDLIAGLSKFPRMVKYMAKGLWVQEELTNCLADELIVRLAPLGVAVVMQAEHMCMSMRGVQQPGVVTTTSAMRGVFSDHTRTAKAELMSILRLR